MNNKNPDFSVRMFTDTDTEIFSEMVYALYAEDPEGEPMNSDKIRYTIKEFSQHPEKGSIHILCISGITSGYAITTNVWSNEYGKNLCIIDEIYVLPEYRGNGLSTAFINYLFRSCEFSNYAAFCIETTPSNSKARNYYQHLGFSSCTNFHMIKKNTGK